MSERMTTTEYRNLQSKKRAPYAKHEHDLQASVFSVLRNEHNLEMYPFLKFIFAVPNFSMRTKRQAGEAKAEGMTPGVWDICVPFARYGWHGLWIENKIAGNKLTDAQKEFEAHFISEHYLTRICYTLEQNLATIEDYLSIKLRWF